MRKATLALTGIIFLLSGCGGGHAVKHQAAAAVVVPQRSQVALPFARRCDAMNYSMQCGLFGQPRPPLSLAQSVPTIPGVDFAWGGPRSCSAMQSLGARFAWSYFSNDSSKNWTGALVNEFHRCGIQTAGGWETTAMRATAGPIAGAQDAMADRDLSAGVGNSDGAITLAVDCDCPGSQIRGYFEGAHGVVGSRLNAYGGYYQLLYLYQRGLVGHLNFQTYAWSYGLWLPVVIAPLEQYLNDGSVDYDRALAASFGQWPAPGPVGPTPQQLAHWRQAKNSSFQAYHGRHCTGGIPERAHHCDVFAQRVVYFQQQLWAKEPRFHCFGPGAKRTALVCWIVRPSVHYWSQARDASARAYHRNGCTSSGQDHCGVLAQRERYFAAKVKQFFL